MIDRILESNAICVLGLEIKTTPVVKTYHFLQYMLGSLRNNIVSSM